MARVNENTNYKPTVFWAWNGDMRDDVIKRSIAEFDEAGIGGLHLHARAGLTLEYMGKEWMRAYKTTIEECKARGMDIWIYDEQGWPSGFAGGKVNAFGEKYLLKFLCKSEKYDKSFESRLLVAYKKDARGYVRTKSIDSADLYVYYSIQEHYVDLLNPNVCKEFINCTHEEYKKLFQNEFGKTIKGVFTDEPQIHVSSKAWSVAIPAAFKERFNEDVLDKLYLLFESEGEAYEEFRYKYYSVVRDLFIRNYTKKLYEWCEENNLILTGHFAGEEGLCVQVASNTGVMPHYEFMHQPGIDHLGRRLNPVLLMKQIQSVANQFSKKRILSETFACTGNGVNFKDLAWIWNYQSAFGVNCPCMSISMYRLGGVRMRDYPVFLSSQQPWWKEFSAFNTFLTNTCEFEAEGEFKSDIMVLSAINGTLCEPIFSLKQRIISSAYRRLVESMVSLQLPFDIGDETLLSRHGEIKDGKLKLGKCSYSYLVLPQTSNITAKTLDLICEFVRAGGKVLCMSEYPQRLEGKETDEAAKRLRQCGVERIQQRKGIIEKYFRNMGYKRSVFATDAVGKLSEDLILTYKETHTGKNIVLMNPSADATKSVWLRVAEQGAFKKADVNSGERKNTESVNFANDTATFVTLQPKQCVRFSFYKGAQSEEAQEKSQATLDLEVKKVTLSDNALTLDKARYRLGEHPYSEEMPLVKAIDLIYKEAEDFGETTSLSLKYSFECIDVPLKISLAAETENAKAIFINGNEIECKTQSRFLDKDFWLYDISRKVRKGLNEIELRYEIKPLNLGFDLNSVHDSVRNKFSYPVAIESVYLTGDFSVKSASAVEKYPGFIRTAGGFKICKRVKASASSDITEQGNWFYPGNAVYETQFKVKKGEKISLHLEYDGTIAKIIVNGENAGTDFLAGEDTDITPYLKNGKNELQIKIFGSIRNLMGPHHHCKGEPEYTGVHTFTGEYGNGAVEDLSAEEMPDAVWNDSYAFIRLGLNKVKLIYKK